MKKQAKKLVWEETTGINFVVDEDLVKALFEAAKNSNRHDVNYDRTTSYEVDFFPNNIKFRDVSLLKILLQKTDYDLLFGFGVRLNEIGQKHGLWDYSNHKFRKQLPLEDYVEKMLMKVFDRYGANTWVEGMSHLDEVNRLRIYKIKFLNGIDTPVKHAIGFMSTMKKEAPIAYDFLLHFFKICNQIGISSWGDDNYDMLLDMVLHNLEDRFDDSDPEMQKTLQNIINEGYSYKKGLAKQLYQDIYNYNCKKLSLIDHFYRWQKEDDSGLPNKIKSEIERMCWLMSQEIYIQDYEQYGDFEQDETGYSNCWLFHMCYDYGNIFEEMDAYTESMGNDQGYIELADSLVLTKNEKIPFKEKGQLLVEFLQLWNKTKLFLFYDDKFKPITSTEDGASIRHSLVQTREKKIVRKHLIRRSTQNRKRKNTGRKTVAGTGS